MIGPYEVKIPTQQKPRWVGHPRSEILRALLKHRSSTVLASAIIPANV